MQKQFEVVVAWDESVWTVVFHKSDGRVEEYIYDTLSVAKDEGTSIWLAIIESNDPDDVAWHGRYPVGSKVVYKRYSKAGRLMDSDEAEVMPAEAFNV